MHGLFSTYVLPMYLVSLSLLLSLSTLPTARCLRMLLRRSRVPTRPCLPRPSQQRNGLPFYTTTTFLRSSCYSAAQSLLLCSPSRQYSLRRPCFSESSLLPQKRGYLVRVAASGRADVSGTAQQAQLAQLSEARASSPSAGPFLFRFLPMLALSRVGPLLAVAPLPLITIVCTTLRSSTSACSLVRASSTFRR